MYGEKIQEKGDTPVTIHQPELEQIIENLKNALKCYESIVLDTRDRLQKIKRYDETLNLIDDLKENEPESLTDRLNQLVFRLVELNVKAEGNLMHLKEIA